MKNKSVKSVMTVPGMLVHEALNDGTFYSYLVVSYDDAACRALVLLVNSSDTMFVERMNWGRYTVPQSRYEVIVSP
jgi:hypothetical protein